MSALNIQMRSKNIFFRYGHQLTQLCVKVWSKICTFKGTTKYGHTLLYFYVVSLGSVDIYFTSLEIYCLVLFCFVVVAFCYDITISEWVRVINLPTFRVVSLVFGNRIAHDYPWDNPLQWRHKEHDGVSNHQPHDCLLNRLFRSRSKSTSNLRVTGLCVWNSPITGEFPAPMANNAENVSIWWRHHAYDKINR